jgi:hypothetical protein
MIPPFIDALTANWEDLIKEVEGSARSALSGDNRGRASSALQSYLEEELRGCGVAARAGRDVLDPYECFG